MNDKMEMDHKQYDMNTMRRLMSYMRDFRILLVVVIICILLSAIASAASSMFLQTLIDDYIIPLLGVEQPDFSGLIHALMTIGLVYVIGIVSTLIYNRLMVIAAQGTLKRIRDEMFTGMQRLPIRYFDTHTHGEIMSLYTNDTDTLRQMIAQSMSQLVSSVFTVVVVFVCMLYISVPLSIAVKWYLGDGQNYDSSEPSNRATFSVLVSEDEETVYTRRD